jgi:hypothetical protein
LGGEVPYRGAVYHALGAGGADRLFSPSNMAWQTTAEAKAKDKVERQGAIRIAERSLAPRGESPAAWSANHSAARDL